MEMPVEKKANRTWAIVGTVAAILLCGCPGLTMCVFGAYTATGSAPDVINGYGNMPGGVGFGLLCVAIIFIAIAVVVPILLLRKKKPAAADVDVLPPQEPLPRLHNARHFSGAHPRAPLFFYPETIFIPQFFYWNKQFILRPENSIIQPCRGRCEPPAQARVHR